ncbi:MAG: tyrosine-type recombinase/integrase [Casimicrobium sp.]
MIEKTAAGKWKVDVQPGGRGGLRRYRRTFTTKAEALAYERELQGGAVADLDFVRPRHDNRRLSELLHMWFTQHAAHLNSGDDMKSRIAAVIASVGDVPARQFTATMFANYRTQRLSAGLSPATLNREHAYMRSMFSELVRNGQWPHNNPLKQLRQLRVQERELSYLTGEDLTALLNATKKSRNPDLELVVKLALSTGARWSEVERLPKSGFRPGLVTFANTKGLKVRSVPISAPLTQELALQAAKTPSGSLFFTPCYSAFREAIERAQIQLPAGQLAHVLRHTFASHFMQRGGSILALQKLLGHSDLKVTMRYAHLAPAHLEEVLRLNPLAD